MTVLARDAVASDHLVYAWPFPIGPEDHEVACAEDEQVVMCPSWTVGDRLGPGRHHWRSPDPTRPVSAFFVLVSAVEVGFDMITMFMIPTTGQPVRLRAAGSLQVRCQDPGLLIAQFVGLPFDSVNDGILRSVSRSVERMLARLLTRRVVMAASPVAVTDPGMLPGIIEELIAYNPTAGAVFGVELIRMGHLTIVADDGSTPQIELVHNVDWSGGHHRVPANGESHHGPEAPTARSSSPDLLETQRGRAAGPHAETQPPPMMSKATVRHASVPPAADRSRLQSPPPGALAAASGEIVVKKPTLTDAAPPPPKPAPAPGASAVPVETRSTDDITQPGMRAPGSSASAVHVTSSPSGGVQVSEATREGHGSILGIGVSHVGSHVVSGEIPTKVAPGARVLVPGPNGLMQSATVRQLLQGYYELEVGSSGETIWVPINHVVPE